LGSRLPKKKWFEENILLELKKDQKLKILVIGSGWNKADFYLKAVRFLLKKVKNRSLKTIFDRMTVKVKPEQEGELYRSAKICLNFHEREEDGSQPHYIVNSRTFKIPACGGFQICDEVPAIRKYFSDQEVVMCPINKEIWIQTIHYYLKNESERIQIQSKGIQRAKLNHFSTNRCLDLLELLKSK
jgi:spore maturation protein CgeB